MKESDFKLGLQNRYSETLNFLLLNGMEDYKVFFSLNTVNNLIVHFDKLTEDARLEVYNAINSYFELIKTMDKDEIEKMTRNLFSQYLEPIILKYYLKIGFAVLMTMRAYVLIYVSIILILILFSLPLFVFIIIFILMFIFQLWILNKKKKNLVYGHKY